METGFHYHLQLNWVYSKNFTTLIFKEVEMDETRLWEIIKSRVSFLITENKLRGQGSELGFALCEYIAELEARVKKLETFVKLSTEGLSPSEIEKL